MSKIERACAIVTSLNGIDEASKKGQDTLKAYVTEIEPQVAIGKCEVEIRPPTRVGKDGKTAEENTYAGFLQFSGLRQQEHSVGQYLAELLPLLAALKLIAAAMNGPVTEGEVKIKKDGTKEKHYFRGGLDMGKDKSKADGLPAMFNKACNQVMIAAQWAGERKEQRTTPYTKAEVMSLVSAWLGAKN
jgi:hypothetical protein